MLRQNLSALNGFDITNRVHGFHKAAEQYNPKSKLFCSINYNLIKKTRESTRWCLTSDLLLKLYFKKKIFIKRVKQGTVDYAHLKKPSKIALSSKYRCKFVLGFNLKVLQENPYIARTNKR